jgi:hypothetical protein
MSRRTPYLFDPSGYGHTIKNKKKNGSVIWRCTVRPKQNACPALVCQEGSTYTTTKEHSCSLDKHKKVRLQLIAETKNGCLEDNFKSTMAIAQPMLLKASKENKGAILPTPHALAAAGNRIRSKTRPKHPKSQFFDIDKDNIPTGFFQ